MKSLLIVCALFMLTGCGKTIAQVKDAAHAVIDIGAKVYEDLRDDAETVKGVVAPDEVPVKPVAPVK